MYFLISDALPSNHRDSISGHVHERLARCLLVVTSVLGEVSKPHNRIPPWALKTYGYSGIPLSLKQEANPSERTIRTAYTAERLVYLHSCSNPSKLGSTPCKLGSTAKYNDLNMHTISSHHLICNVSLNINIHICNTLASCWITDTIQSWSNAINENDTRPYINCNAICGKS